MTSLSPPLLGASMPAALSPMDPRALAAGGGWTPLEISPYAWWSANRPDLITLSGAQVTSLKDVIEADDFAQATGANRPLYDATGFNGARCLTFNGSSSRLDIVPVPARYPLNQFEIWAIFDNEGDDADLQTRRVFTFGGTTTNNSVAITLAVSGGVQTLGAYVGTGAAASFATVAGVDAKGRHAARLIVDDGIQLGMDGGLGSKQGLTPAIGTAMVRMGLATNSAGPMKGKISDVVFAPLLGDDTAAMWAWAEIQRRA